VAAGDEIQPRVSRDGFMLAQECLTTRILGTGTAALFLTTMTPVTEAFRTDLSAMERQRQLDTYDDYNQIIRDVALRRGAYLLDAHEVFASLPHAELDSLLAEDGIHLTEAGEQLLAESLLRAIEQSGLPGAGRSPATD